VSLRKTDLVPLPGEIVLVRDRETPSSPIMPRFFLDGLPLDCHAEGHKEVALEWWEPLAVAGGKVGLWQGVAVHTAADGLDPGVYVYLENGEEFEAREDHRFRWPRKK